MDDRVSRRQVLKRLALALGGTLQLPILGAALGCRRPAAEDVPWTPSTLSADQTRWVQAVADTIVPETDTPGATAAGVHEFIDLLLTDWLSAEERDRFLAGLAELDASSRESYGAAVDELRPAQRLELLTPLDAEAVEARKEEVDPLPFFATMKEMTLVGYYTSEIGMTQELAYRFHFPSFDGCVDLDEDQRAWSWD